MSKTLTQHAEKMYKQFADKVYADYLQKRFGLATCKPLKNSTLASIRQEMLDYQMNSDEGAFTFVSHNFSLKDPIYYPEEKRTCSTHDHISTPVCYVDRPVGTQPGCANSHIDVNDGNGNHNVIEINSGGCVTRINLNNTVNIRTMNYTWIQDVPATMWDIQHNLGFNPNVRTEDPSEVDIEGVVEYLNPNRLRIHFNSAVAGTAYLS